MANMCTNFASLNVFPINMPILLFFILTHKTLSNSTFRLLLKSFKKWLRLYVFVVFVSVMNVTIM